MRLQGHEKFALREGWLNKGLLILNDDKSNYYDSYYENPEDRHFAFTRKNAPDVFGMGNNMVKSVRFWMRACGLLNELGGNAGTRLSELAKLILKYDLYLENPFTLWILHSNLVKNFEEATTWNLFFNKCNVDELNRTQIFEILNRELNKVADGKSFSEKSLKADIDVLLNLYISKEGKADPEEKNNSPFASLGLLKENVGNTYSKIIGNKKGLSEWNIYYEIVQKFSGTITTISIDELIEGKDGIQKIYQLPSVTINEYLDRLDSLGLIRINRTAGLNVIYKVKDDTMIDVVKKYYERR